MKKKFRFLIVTLVLFLGLGLTSSASAAVSFSIDFGQDGIMDTDWTLEAGESIMVDLWVNDVPVGNGVPGFGFGFGVLPGAEINFEILNYELTYPIVDMGGSEIFAGGFAIDAVIFPPGTFWEGSFKMVSFELLCTAPSIDELWIYDYWPISTQWILSDGTILDDTILPQHLATLTQTPVPAAVWLLASGLLGLVGLKRRKKE
ncbi:MAG: VPLPA-CTERM sorting domain-containing protein [Bacteroidales bacterium]|nr:VPLPA-CTERM sorting domain-containing protein [Bacteroidales bacterium]